MTIRGYCEQTGLRLRFRRSNGGWACEIVGLILKEERVPASAVGSTADDARIALAKLIAGHILQETIRPSTLYWVPTDLSP